MAFDPTKFGATLVQPSNVTTSGGFNPSAFGATPVNAPAGTSVLKATIQGAESAFNSPAHQSFDPTVMVKSVEDTYMGAIKDASSKLDKAVSDFGNVSNTQFAGDLANVGLGAVSAVLAPISSVFKGAENVPVLGFVAKGINSLFSAIGSGAGELGVQGLNSLPLSPETKNALAPSVRDASALAGQLVAGKLGIDEIPNKLSELASKSKTILNTIKDNADIASTIQNPPKTETRAPIETQTPTPQAPQPEVQSAQTASVPTQPVSTISPELQTLAQEAMKYKTAEEFVNAIKNNPEKIPTTPEYQKYLSDQNSFVQRETEIYAEMKSMRDKYSATTIDKVPASDIAKYDKLQEELNQTLSKKTLAKIPEGVIKTHIGGKGLETELTDFYNKVKSSQAVRPEVIPIQGTGETKTRGLSLGVEQAAIEKNLTKSFGDLPEYQTMNIKDQAKRASDLINTNYEQAKRIALGQETSPIGLHPEAVFTAVELKATQMGDVNTLRDLATKSSLTTEATSMGQRIKLLDERNPDSPVRAIRDVAASREKMAIGRVKDVTKEKLSTARDIENEMKAVKPKKQNWVEFIRSIQC